MAAVGELPSTTSEEFMVALVELLKQPIVRFRISFNARKGFPVGTRRKAKASKFSTGNPRRDDRTNELGPLSPCFDVALRRNMSIKGTLWDAFC